MSFTDSSCSLNNSLIQFDSCFCFSSCKKYLVHLSLSVAQNAFDLNMALYIFPPLSLTALTSNFHISNTGLSRLHLII